LEDLLNSLGIYYFRQVAGFSATDIAWVDSKLRFKGRIVRDRWVDQAKRLS
jgi:NADH-quinone oxidoreductase subunit E